MIDTAGTLCEAAKVLKENGATKVYAFATHGIFSGQAGDRIASTPELERVITTDSLNVKDEFKNKLGSKYVQVSLGLMLAETIRRVH
jgi:ribose-phosphate pyrophosphokinase